MEMEYLHIIYSVNTKDVDKFPDCEKMPNFFTYPSATVSKRVMNYWINILDAAGYNMEVNLMGKMFDGVTGPVYRATAPEGFPISYVIIIVPVPRAAPYKFVFQPVTGDVNGALLRVPVVEKKESKKLDWKKEYPEYPKDEREMTPERKDILESIYQILDRDDET